MIGLSGIVVLDSGSGLPEMSTACGGLTPSPMGVMVFELPTVARFELAVVPVLLARFVFVVVFVLTVVFELAEELDCCINPAAGGLLLQASVTAI